MNNGIYAVVKRYEQDGVEFENLALAITDEQHRFGVAQRAKLWSKNTNPPHVLVMTATPIPRTLAMTLYGDLDVSVIDELPPGRKPVQTIHATEGKRTAMYNFMRDQIVLGRQVFVVYPLIFETEKVDYQSLEEGIEQGIEQGVSQTIRQLHSKGMPASQIADFLDMSLDQVESILAEK